VQKVELTARGGMKNYSILRDLKLPEWAADGGLAWPLHRPVVPLLDYSMIGGDPRRYSPRWYEINEEKGRRQGQG
jgi:hypothetical protein